MQKNSNKLCNEMDVVMGMEKSINVKHIEFIMKLWILIAIQKIIFHDSILTSVPYFPYCKVNIFIFHR